MVLTRSSRRNECCGATKHAADSGTIQTQHSLPKKRNKRRLTTDIRHETHTKLSTNTGSMDNFSVTSPTPGEPSLRDTDDTARPESKTAYTARPQLMSPKRRNTAGSAHDPIELGDSPPLHHFAVTQKPKSTATPHKFQSRHRELYSYQPSHSGLVAQPANGNLFTGNLSHDIYRMMNAKTVAHDWKIPSAPSRALFGTDPRSVLPASNHATSSRNIAHQTPTAYQSPYATNYPLKSYSHHHARMGVALSGGSEDMLRKKTSRYIQEISRSQSRDGTPQPTHEMNRLETGERALQASLAQPTSWIPLASSNEGPSEARGSSHHITQLVAQTTLLTSLLQVYPTCSDQQALRSDISQLAVVQATTIKTWLESEQNISKKRRRSDTDSAISVGGDTPVIDELMHKSNDTAEDRVRMEKDEEFRRAMSATGDLWRDGSGVGVAHVFAVTDRSQTPTETEGEKWGH